MIVSTTEHFSRRNDERLVSDTKVQRSSFLHLASELQVHAEALGGFVGLFFAMLSSEFL